MLFTNFLMSKYLKSDLIFDNCFEDITYKSTCKDQSIMDIKDFADGSTCRDIDRCEYKRCFCNETENDTMDIVNDLDYDYINSKIDVVKRCKTCKEISLKSKEHQEYEAARNAKDLLKQVEEERKAKEQKEVKQAKKREKKKAKKKAKQDDKEVDIPKSENKNVKDDFVNLKSENHIVNIVKFTPPFPDLQSTNNNNNENINPNNCVPVKSNKRLRTKHEIDKIKINSSDKSMTDGETFTSKKESTKDIGINKEITNRSTLSLSNDNNSQNSNKGNAWFHNNSNIVLCGNKIEENSINSNWQKIGGSRKKVDIQVNKKDIGKVIGQGGSVVNAIRHITGAHIDIDSMANDLDERSVHLKGTLEAVTRAKDYICDLLEGNITGNVVIKECEAFISKSSSGPKPAIDYSASSAASDFEFSKTSHIKSLPIIRQNGKGTKVGYSKFGVTSSGVSSVSSLQYGFSKSVKGPDFASVAAAGIVTRYSPTFMNSRPKYPGTISAVDSFPSLSESNSDMYTSSDHSFPSSTLTNESVHTSCINEPLEINTNLSSQPPVTQGGLLKSFPLAPGSERSLHLRTYNSTPEQSPQLNHISRPPQLRSSERDDVSESKRGTAGFYIPSVGRTSNSGRMNSSLEYGRPSQDLSTFGEPGPGIDLEVDMTCYPKLQSLNPKAEAFSPSFPTNGSDASCGLRPELFYYNVNGTLTLNPTASSFTPRHPSAPTSSACSLPPGSCDVLYSTPPLPVQEERLIRLQDHINMAINILLRTNGFDHNMAEAAFLSFMRSANLDLNTHLTTTEFTALINNIINQSHTPGAQSIQSSQPTPSFIPKESPPSSFDENMARLLCTPGQQSPQYRLMNQPHTSSAQTHWPSMINNFSTQSIWAPGSINAPVLSASPFFPSVNQCVSAQAVFNNVLSFSLSNENMSSSSSSSPYFPQSQYQTLATGHKFLDSALMHSMVAPNRTPILDIQSTKMYDHIHGFDQEG